MFDKEVIIPNFLECKDKILKDFSYGNEILAKKYFKVADSEKQFINLIEKFTKKK